jgi:hypothetical protein
VALVGSQVRGPPLDRDRPEAGVLAKPRLGAHRRETYTPLLGVGPALQKSGMLASDGTSEESKTVVRDRRFRCASRMSTKPTFAVFAIATTATPMMSNTASARSATERIRTSTIHKDHKALNRLKHWREMTICPFAGMFPRWMTICEQIARHLLSRLLSRPLIPRLIPAHSA